MAIVTAVEAVFAGRLPGLVRLRAFSVNELVDFVIKLFHLGDRSVLFEEDLIHVCLRVVIVSNVPIVDSLGQNLGTLLRLRLLR